MGQIVDYTAAFQQITQRLLGEMFGTAHCVASPVEEASSVHTEKSFIVSLYYTGTVYGEYLLAMDEEVAARMIGYDEPIADDDRDVVRHAISDALSETLNVIVGEAIVELQDSYSKLTITSPRVYFGEIRYPQFRTGKSVLQTSHGEIECFFCLDRMRLSLAASYDEALASLMETNGKLKEANRHLAQQQAKLVQAEKMASIGVLASGVAHEINTPLFFVDMNLSVMDENIALIEALLHRYEKIEQRLEADGLPPDNEDDNFAEILNETREVVAEARDGVKRIKTVVTSLNEFSSMDQSGFAEADVNLIAKNACTLVASLLPEGCKIQQDLAELPLVYCNSGEIGQVLANVLTNAAQVVDVGGHIQVSSHAVDEDVVFTIVDDGPGVAEEHVAQIFDPFFTTRDVGEGSGLGLSVSYGIVTKHSGSISIESQPGQGAKVTIRLPVSPQEACC